MAYGGYGYGQEGRGGNPYAQESSNPYAQQNANPYAQQGQYGNAYGQRQDAGAQPYGGNDVEMGNLSSDPNAILNECREIDRGIDTIQQNLVALRAVQKQSLDSSDTSPQSPANRELDRMRADTMTLYRNFAARVKNLRSRPEAGNQKNERQVNKVDRRLRAVIQEYQTLEQDCRRQLQAQVERNYRIVNPDASDDEVRRVVEDTSSNQIFSQAMLQSDRRGQVQSALGAVNDRHRAIQRIVAQLMELDELFKDLDTLVVQQDPAVVRIEERGQEVTNHVEKANNEMSNAITSARSRNRKKWWCLLVVLLIIIVIVIIVVLVTVLRKKA